MKRVLSIIFLLLSLNYGYSQVYTPLGLPAVIADNMVLQQKINVPIWGWTSPNEKVIVNASWLDNSITIKADEKGKWNTKLQTRGAGSKKFSIQIVSQDEIIIISNILFGEVWLASGQSNMQMPLKGWGSQHVAESEETMENSLNPNIRLFQVRQNTSPKPLDNCTGAWLESNPESVAGFSSVAYFFAKKLNEELNIPIGIIHSSWGGTKAQAWVSRKKLHEMEDFWNETDSLDINYANFKKTFSRWDDAMAKIKGETVIVYSKEIKYPKYVRMGWEHTAQPNLFNKAGLPASPFNTK
ncbi:MAG: sialate O-acetylesterase [Bacteroidota bacterium]